MADALSCKSVGSLGGVSCIRISVDSHLMGLIREAQIEGVREENWKKERIRGEITIFVLDSRGLLTRCGQVWVPMYGGIKQNVL